MENKKILKIIIFILSIIIAIIISILLLIKNDPVGKKVLEEATKKQEDPIINEKNEYGEVKSPTKFYTVERALERYLNIVHLDYENQEEDANAILYGISNPEEKNEKILKILDVDFIKENDINNNSLNEYIPIDVDEIELIRIKEMDILEKEQFDTYRVHIQYYTKSGKKFSEYFIITLDEFNSTYMVKPVGNVKDIEEIKLEADKNYDKIENNDNVNKYYYVRVDDAEMTAKYLKEYRNLVFKDPEEIYNILDKEYREKRFENYEMFKQYVEKNEYEIRRTTIKQYLVNEIQNGKEYVCKDANGNIYIFTANSVSNYTVQLDTHTIDSDEFKDTYDLANEQNKVAMHIGKWESMINTRDYEAAYNVLDETFRNENFGSLENFEDYMRTMYPEHYDIEIKDVKKESNAYVAEVELKQRNIQSVTGEGVYPNTIMVQIKDNREFVMSFFVRRH